MKRVSCHPLWIYSVLYFVLTCGCASQTGDQVRAAAVPPSAQPAPSTPPPRHPMAAQPELANESPLREQESAADVEATGRSDTPPHSIAAAKSNTSTSATTSRGRRAIAPPSAPAKPKRAEAADAAEHRSEASPAFAESPELHDALGEFETQWQTLANLRACDDACRAMESMRRTAQRICELVVAGDPQERCRSARARLEQASRDLAARCAECR